MTDLLTHAPTRQRDSLKGALARVPLTAAVDLGASKVACFIMKPDGVHRADRTLSACGVGYVQSRGVRGGAVVDLDAAGGALAVVGQPGRIGLGRIGPGLEKWVRSTLAAER